MSTDALPSLDASGRHRTDGSHSIRAADRSHSRRRAASLAAIGSGLLLLAVAALLAWRGGLLPVAEVPTHRYVLGHPVAADALGPLAPLADRQGSVRRGVVVAGGGGGGGGADARKLAEFSFAESDDGPVLVDWRARVDDPFLKLMPAPDEVAAVSEALARHVRAGATVLAWWDLSRQFRLLSGVDVAFGEQLGTPLFVPQQWGAQREAVETIERAFWQLDDAPEQRQRFDRFVHALLADEESGIAELRALADGKRTVLVLHVRDAILLGQLQPEKLGVAFRDLGDMSDVHGMVRRVHAWLDEHEYRAYTVTHAKGQPVRAVALTDEAAGETLAARLLPMIGNRQEDVAGATLVYRVGGFVVYEIGAQASQGEREAGR
ncbi:MAG TPA: hydroxylamine oxidation protein HaoB [Burkholderiaceae bacterium]|nr:hydroxylamine oxidation protein HaoB [Burkholderiaceae bacterium]